MRGTAIVTGASGFIGSNLCTGLIARGFRVRAMVRESSSREFLGPLDVEYAVSTLHDATSLGAAMEDADVLFHIAAKASDWGSLEEFRKNNVGGTRSVLEAAAARGVKRVYFMSSLSVHAFSGLEDASEDTPLLEGSGFSYGLSKAEAERHAFELARDKGLQLSAARTGVAYGPNDHSVFEKLADGIQSGLYQHVGGGGTYGPFCYVENLVDGMILCATHERAVGRVYNLVDDGKVTWRQFADAACDALAWPRVTKRVPLALARIAGAACEGAYRLVGAKREPPLTRYRIAYVARHLHFSNARAKEELGWKPEIGMEEGLKRTAKWYLERKKGKT